MKRTITIATLAIAAMVGCAKEESSTLTLSDTSATFASTITTRASNDEWSAGDQIGIMVTSDNDLVDGYRVNNCYNVTFTDPTQGTFTADTAADQIYYSVDEEDKVDFFAYCPYLSTLGADYKYPISVVDQADPEKIDFIEASTKDDGNGGYNKLSGTVPLTFTHRMSKITLILKAGVGVTLDDITAVTLKGYYTTAKYDLPTNSFEDLGGTTSDITPLDGGDYTHSAILIPESATSHMIYFTTTHGDVPLDLTSESLEAGNHVEYTVTVNQTEATYSANKINGWEPDTDG